MPRKFLKRIMPDHSTMREHPHLQKFGERLTEPKLWHLDRRTVSGGLALGLFVGFIPFFGQIFIAAALAILFRVNLPIAVMSVWITNPVTVGPIFYFAYQIGAWILGVSVIESNFTMSWEWFSTEFLTIWQPVILGCLICGSIAAILAIVLVRLIWRISVIRSWSKRKRKNIK